MIIQKGKENIIWNLFEKKNNTEINKNFVDLHHHRWAHLLAQF